MFFIKLTTNIKKKIDILLIFDVQGKKSLLAKEQEKISKTPIAFECLQMREDVKISLIIWQGKKNVVHSRMLLTINH